MLRYVVYTVLSWIGCFNNLETSHGHRRCNNDYVTETSCRSAHSVFIDVEAMPER